MKSIEVINLHDIVLYVFGWLHFDMSNGVLSLNYFYLSLYFSACFFPVSTYMPLSIKHTHTLLYFLCISRFSNYKYLDLFCMFLSIFLFIFYGTFIYLFIFSLYQTHKLYLHLIFSVSLVFLSTTSTFIFFRE